MKGHCLRVGAIALVGFVIFESLILAIDWLLTGGHVFTWAIAESLLLNATIWTIILTLVYLVFVRFIARSHHATS